MVRYWRNEDHGLGFFGWIELSAESCTQSQWCPFCTPPSRCLRGGRTISQRRVTGSLSRFDCCPLLDLGLSAGQPQNKEWASWSLPHPRSSWLRTRFTTLAATISTYLLWLVEDAFGNTPRKIHYNIPAVPVPLGYDLVLLRKRWTNWTQLLNPNFRNRMRQTRFFFTLVRFKVSKKKFCIPSALQTPVSISR